MTIIIIMTLMTITMMIIIIPKIDIREQDKRRQLYTLINQCESSWTPRQKKILFSNDLTNACSLQ